MRVTVTTDIFCDANGCEKYIGFSGAGKSLMGARREARKARWAKLGAYYFCPIHKKAAPANLG